MRRDIGHPYRGVSCPSRPPTGRTDKTNRDMSQMSRKEDAALIASARRSLGPAYGLARPLRKVELARLVGLGPDYVARLERGTGALSGPVYVVIRMLMAGHRSPWHEDALRSRYHVTPAPPP